MNGKLLAVLVAFGLGIGAYALFSLPRRDTAPERRTEAKAKPASGPAVRPDEAPPPWMSPPAGSPSPRGPRINPPVVPADGSVPQASPKPLPSLAEAREGFDDLIAELEREIKRGEEVGRPISNEAWVEYYRRGNEAIDPILRQIDRSQPGAQDEINDRMEILRTKLDALRPNSP